MPASPINPPGIVPDAITIIIVTFQNAEHIAACLQSLIEAEPVRRVFLFLIDNASTDGTNEIIRHAILNLPKARFHAEFIANAENFGFTRAVNQGMARHRTVCADHGGPVLFLNPDTILPPRSLAALLKKLYATPGTGVIAPQLVHEDGRIQPLAAVFQRSGIYFASYRACHVCGQARRASIAGKWATSIIARQWKSISRKALAFWPVRKL
jgi:GT2 family glycosyltransferase